MFSINGGIYVLGTVLCLVANFLTLTDINVLKHENADCSPHKFLRTDDGNAIKFDSFLCLV